LASWQIQYWDYFCIKNKKNKITQKPKGIYEATFTILHKEKEKIKEFEVDISFDFKKISYSDTSEPSEVKTIIQFSVITIREIRIYDWSWRILFWDEINSYNERAEELKKILFQILKKISWWSLEVIWRQLIQ
jgi:hypothetical protein